MDSLVLEEQKEKLDVGTTGIDLDSESSSVSPLKSDNASNANSKESPAIINPYQTSSEESQDSVSLTVKDDDCLIVSNDSKFQKDRESTLSELLKKDGKKTTEADTPRLVEKKFDRDEDSAPLIFCSNGEETVTPTTDSSQNELNDKKESVKDSSQNELNDKKESVKDPSQNELNDKKESVKDSSQNELNDKKESVKDSSQNELNDKKESVKDAENDVSISQKTLADDDTLMSPKTNDTDTLASLKTNDTEDDLPDSKKTSADVSKKTSADVSVLESPKTTRPGVKKPRAKSQISDMSPAMLEQLRFPFKHGWKREVVNRNVTDSGKRGQCDIYYFAPSGKKLRSMVEIADWLESNNSGPVQHKHFSFARMPLFEPPAEVVRDAGKPRNLSSQQLKSPITTPKLPVRKPTSRIKLSKVLPKPTDVPKSTPKVVKVAQPKSSLLKALSLTPSLGHSYLGKRPLNKATKVPGYSFLKKRRLSPEWRPSDDDHQGQAQVFYPKTPTKDKASEEDELQSILGTPSKLISSIVNPEPPKEIIVSKMSTTQIAGVSGTNPSILQVPGPNPPSLRFHIVTKKDASPNEILAQLGFNSKNVRMFNTPSRVSSLDFPKKTSEPRIIYLPAGPRHFKSADNYVQSVSSTQALGLTPRFMPISSLQNSSVSLSTTSTQPITIRPPPPLSLRPQFSRFPVLYPKSIPLQNPPKLHPASMPVKVLPDPPPLQSPHTMVGTSQVTESGLVPLIADSPSTTTLSTPDSSALLKQLSIQCQARPLMTGAPLNQPLPFHPHISSTTSIGTTAVSFSSSSLSASVSSSKKFNGLDEHGPDINPLGRVVANEPIVVNKVVLKDTVPDTFSPQMTNRSERVMDSMDSNLLGQRTVTVENPDSLKTDSHAGVSSLKRDDPCFLLPISFGNPYPTSENAEKDKMNLIPQNHSSQEVSFSIHFSKLDIYCPTPPVPSSSILGVTATSLSECALEDCENVFLRLPAFHFKHVNLDKPVILKLNGHKLDVSPGFFNFDGEDVKLKTTVKEFKDWVASQSLKMKVCTGQKRKIKLSTVGSKTDYLRSIILLQENYNIMMSIFKQLSIHDLLRACRVCKIWRRMALQKCLWRKVSLFGLGKVRWIPAVNFFLNVDVRTLIMPEPLLSPTETSENLETIVNSLSRMSQLKDIRFGTVSQQMIDSLLEKMPQLKNLGADFIYDAEPDYFSKVTPNTTSTEVAMAHAVDLVLSGCFTVLEAATTTGVPEPDLRHLTQGNHIATRKLDQDSVLLCCMRLSQMGFTIDYSVIETRFQEAVKRKSPSIKISPRAQGLSCQKMWTKNQILLQTKLPYRPQDPIGKKLKAYEFHLRMLYQEIDVTNSSSILAFILKEFTVLNAARNKMHRVTALSVISPANLHLPVMLVFPSAVSYPESHSGLILITAKDGLLTSNLVTHYLRAVFTEVTASSLILFFDGHEHLLSQELVSECVNRSVFLHCVSKEFSEVMFPGNHGGILHSLSKKLGKAMVDEKKFIDLMSFHLRLDWWANWQGMCRAFQQSGIFPLDSSATFALYKSTVDPNVDMSDFEVDGDSSTNSEIVLSSNEDKHVEDEDMQFEGEDKNIENEDNNVEEAVILKPKGLTYRFEEPNVKKTQSDKDKCSVQKENPRKDKDTCVGAASDHKSSEQDRKGKRKRDETEMFDSDVEIVGSSSNDGFSDENNSRDGVSSNRLFIHIDENEKENKDTSQSKSPMRKRVKINDSETSKNVSALDSIIKTIDAVIASSRADYDASINETRLPNLSPHDKTITEKGEEKKVVKSSLKMKLSSKGTAAFVNNDNSMKSSSELEMGCDKIDVKQKYKHDENGTEGSNDEDDEEEDNDDEELGESGDEEDLEVKEDEEVEDEEDLEVKEDEEVEDEEDLEVKEDEEVEDEEDLEIKEDEEVGDEEDLEVKEDEEVEDEESEVEMEDDDESKTTEKIEQGADKPDETEEESSEDENDLEIRAPPSVIVSVILNEQEKVRISPPNRKKKKKKKKNVEKNAHEDVVDQSQGDANNSESNSKKKKKKKKRKKRKKAKKEHGEDGKISMEKEENEKTDPKEDEAAVTEKDTAMIFMKRVSLADHDYVAKFDSDSGHELVEEQLLEEETVTSETEKHSHVDGHGEQESDILQINKESDKRSESSGSSSDSDSSSSCDDSSDSDKEDVSDGTTSSASGSQVIQSTKSRRDDDSSENSESDGEKEESSSSDDEEESNQSEDGGVRNDAKERGKDNKPKGHDDDEDDEGDDQSDEESDDNQSENDEASSETGSKEEAYSDEEEDENEEDDDSKCQLCMGTNPPHSKDMIIDWVDCDHNCGRWFHVICIKRSQSKAVPKHFVCPSCRCKR